jgi:hypothetical protein
MRSTLKCDLETFLYIYIFIFYRVLVIRGYEYLMETDFGFLAGFFNEMRK